MTAVIFILSSVKFIIVVIITQVIISDSARKECLHHRISEIHIDTRQSLVTPESIVDQTDGEELVTFL